MRELEKREEAGEEWIVCCISSSSVFQLIFAHATAARIYYTLDEGETFVAQNFTPSSLNPRTIVYHQTQDGWMLALNNSRSVHEEEWSLLDKEEGEREEGGR